MNNEIAKCTYCETPLQVLEEIICTHIFCQLLSGELSRLWKTPKTEDYGEIFIYCPVCDDGTDRRHSEQMDFWEIIFDTSNAQSFRIARKK